MPLRDYYGQWTTLWKHRLSSLSLGEMVRVRDNSLNSQPNHSPLPDTKTTLCAEKIKHTNARQLDTPF